MRRPWWRVARWLPDARLGAPGHPTYVSLPHQGRGRFDNPRHYTAGYVASAPQVAVGAAFADRQEWVQAMLRPNIPPGSRVALVEFMASELGCSTSTTPRCSSIWA